jgi:hypothetical protein
MADGPVGVPLTDTTTARAVRALVARELGSRDEDQLVLVLLVR